VEVFANAEELSEAAADLIAQAARAGTAARGGFSLVVSGGSTPRRAYELLAERHGSSVPWDAVEVWFGDERFVPPDDARSNYAMVNETLLSRVSIDPRKVHRIPTSGRSREQAAEAYDALLRERAGGSSPARQHRLGIVEITPPPLPAFHHDEALFDLVLLGVGEDGHTASLFPGSPALLDGTRWAAAVEAPEGVEPRQRITLTLAALAHGTVALVLCAGERKRAIVREILTAEPDATRLPAAHIRARGEVRWLLDAAAAGALQQ
jgi:6-phosphogluconolactonase